MIERPFPDPSILLHQQIPKPLHLLNPRSIFGQRWWDINRQRAYARQGYRCHACGVAKGEAEYHRWLEAHEFYDINYETGCVTFVELVALCHACHNFIHSGRLQKLLDKGEISQQKYDDILDRGYVILEAAELVKEAPVSACDWSDWHLVIDGKNYGQKFHSFEEWEKHFR